MVSGADFADQAGRIEADGENEHAVRFEVIQYGAPPKSEEIEVTLFGPGYGEAIAVHLGDGTWLLVDSCIDPASNAPAASTYLQQIGVKSAQVCAIIASHWHDDHVGGMSQLAAMYSSA